MTPALAKAVRRAVRQHPLDRVRAQQLRAFDFMQWATDPSTRRKLPYYAHHAQLQHEIMGYKKALLGAYHEIVVLVLPVGAWVHWGDNYYKMRTSHAMTVAHYPLRHRTSPSAPDSYVPHSSRDQAFLYPIGVPLEPRKPFDMSQRECASGIHFFLDPGQAEDYDL